ncbi:MAG: trypsin-like peptidase domain-containing protein [Oscillospiraceae bacterium]|nr:trypsin-like peptidase domain-containing protein [Oscillospiraceae bacterium]
MKHFKSIAQKGLTLLVAAALGSGITLGYDAYKNSLGSQTVSAAGTETTEGSVDTSLKAASATSETLNDATVTAAAKISPSIVLVENYQAPSSNGEFYIQNGRIYFSQGGSSSGETQEPELAGEGSGIIMSTDGYIITNYHVIEDADKIAVKTNDGTEYEATVVGSDSDADLALLKIDTTGLTAVEVGDSTELQQGEIVMAVGNPGGETFENTVTLGVVSAVERELTMENGSTLKMIQTDAAINPGNSGGALFNLDGQLVGITSAKYEATGYDNIGFAISTSDAMPIINEFLKQAESGSSSTGESGETTSTEDSSETTSTEDGSESTESQNGQSDWEDFFNYYFGNGSSGSSNSQSPQA